tara:strand:- start:26719 stop:27867 length:1149 start_codon:yes stop_codon:yes gene_type:complete
MKNNNNCLPWNLSLVLILLSLVIVVGCSKEDEEEKILPQSQPAVEEEYNSKALLTNYANGYIKPAYSEYLLKVTELKSEIVNFNNTLTEAALQNLRIKWENALLVWQDVAFLDFGPAKFSSYKTNSFPTDTTLISSNISSGSYNLQLNPNYRAAGFQALDFLINGVSSNDAGIVNYFSNTANARVYLLDIVDVLENNANFVNNEWQGSYTNSFINNNGNNGEVIGIFDMVCAINHHYVYSVRLGKIGIPLGIDDFNPMAMPNHVEALYYEKSLPFLFRSLNAMQTFINGNNYVTNITGEGLDDYMTFLKAKTDGQDLQAVINNQFETIRLELANINDPLSNEVLTNSSGVAVLYEKMQQMLVYLKVDMSNSLEVFCPIYEND